MYLRNRTHFLCFYPVVNKSESLEEKEMLWEHKPNVSVSKAFSSCRSEAFDTMLSHKVVLI